MYYGILKVFSIKLTTHSIGSQFSQFPGQIAVILSVPDGNPYVVATGKGALLSAVLDEYVALLKQYPCELDRCILAGYLTQEIVGL